MAFLKWCFLFSFLAVVVSEDLIEQPDSEVRIDENQLLQFLNNKQELFKILEKYTNASTRKKTAIVNDFADELIDNINVVAVHLGVDPTDLPGFEQEFKVLVFKGWIKAVDGKLHGIATIERKGDIKIEYEYPNLTLKLVCGLKKLTFKYYYEVKFVGMGPSGFIEGKSDGSKFTVDITLNLSNLRLDKIKFRLNNVGKISVKITGSIIGAMVNFLSNFIIPFIKPIIGVVLESIIKGGLLAGADFCNKIMCGILNDCDAALLNVLY